MTTANPTTQRKQAKKPKGFTLWAKTALLAKGWSVTDLAARVQRTRGSVSLAINHPGVLPHVESLIKEALKP